MSWQLFKKPELELFYEENLLVADYYDTTSRDRSVHIMNFITFPYFLPSIIIGYNFEPDTIGYISKKLPRGPFWVAIL